MSENFPQMSLNQVKALFRSDFFDNGLAYCESGKVINPSRFKNKLYAQVQGSGKAAYNIILTYEEKLNPRCTCPAARKTPFCKHAAAVLISWAKDPKAFVTLDNAPEFEKAAKKPSVKKGKEESESLMLHGLDALENLISEIALSGLSTITPSRVEEVKELASNLRTYKLRRLSTLLTRLSDILNIVLTDRERFSLSTYAGLIADIVLTAKGVRAIQDGRLKDPRYMEELVGKTWTDRELTQRKDLQLIEIMFDLSETADSFRVFSSYFIDLASKDLLSEKLIIPSHIKKGPNAEKRSYAGSRLYVSEAYQYPGYSPFRIKFKTLEEHPITSEDIDKIIEASEEDFTKAIELFQAFKKDFFAPSDYFALLKPKGFYISGKDVLIFDNTGKAFSLILTDRSELNLNEALEKSMINALFGNFRIHSGKICFEPKSVILECKDNPVFII